MREIRIRRGIALISKKYCPRLDNIDLGSIRRPPHCVRNRPILRMITFTFRVVMRFEWREIPNYRRIDYPRLSNEIRPVKTSDFQQCVCW